jgi:large subunit ribosomal protein L31e
MAEKEIKKAEEAKPEKKSIIDQAKKMAEAKKTGKPITKKEPKTVEKTGPARIFTIPLKMGKPRTTRTRRSVAVLKSFVKKNTGQEAVIDEKLNEYLWSHGTQKPPAKIRVSVESIGDGKASVSLKK